MATFDLVLYEGQNAISIPLQLSEDDAKWTSILTGIAFNSVRTVVDGQWKDFIRGRTSDLNDFDSAEPTKGYIVDILRVGTTPDITGLLPNTTELASLDIGSEPYQTGDEILKEFPLRVQSSLWVKTVPADATDTSSSYITFQTDRNINVYVAYQADATKPTWLDGWEELEDTVETTSYSFSLYRKIFVPGSVSIPGNQYGGGDADQMYLVALNENTYPITVSTPTSYQIAKLEEGKKFFTDRSFYLTDVPEFVDKKLEWIKLPQDDVLNSSDSYMSFEIPDEADVYVAYDATVDQPPQWLDDFDALNSYITTSVGQFRLFKRYYAAGTVLLGGPSAATPPDPDTPLIPGPNASPTYNYVVIVQNLNPPSVVVTVEGTEPNGINVIPLVGTAKGSLNLIGFPKAEDADMTIAGNIDARIGTYTQLLRLNKGIWESTVPGRDALLNWYPAELQRGLGYLLITSKTEDEELEIDYDG